MSDAGDIIRECRKRRGMSAVKLSEIIGVTPQTISRIENGTDPTFSRMEEIMNALGYYIIIRPKETYDIERRL